MEAAPGSPTLSEHLLHIPGTSTAQFYGLMPEKGRQRKTKGKDVVRC